MDIKPCRILWSGGRKKVVARRGNIQPAERLERRRMIEKEVRGYRAVSKEKKASAGKGGREGRK